MLSGVEPPLYFAFLTPRSRRKEPRTMALDTNVAARISDEAKTVRNCWSPRRSMTRGMRAPVIPMSIKEIEKSKIREIFRCKRMLERRMIGIGKTTRRMSVIISVMPIVSR